MKVKIIKKAFTNAWYDKHIGEIFEVFKGSNKYNRNYYFLVDDEKLRIYFKDCEIVG